MENKRFWEAFEPPFTCDDQSATIEDKNGNVILTIRGWSYLSHKYEHDDAFQLQLDIAHFLSDKLNELYDYTTDQERDEDWERTEDDKLDNKDITF